MKLLRSRALLVMTTKVQRVSNLDASTYICIYVLVLGELS